MKHARLTIVIEYDYDENELRKDGTLRSWGEGFADGCLSMVEILAEHTEDHGKGVCNIEVRRNDEG